MLSVQEKARYFKQRLAGLADSHSDLIESVRGEGLMQGLKCHALNSDVVTAFRAQNLLSVPAGDNVVRLLPPLVVSREELSEAIDKMDAALTGMKATTTPQAG